MHQKEHKPGAPGLSLADIYHILFRHKWKIIAIWLVGAGVAGALWYTSPILYKSQAKLLIRYVDESRPLDPINQADTTIRTPDSRGSSIINTELEILRSYDLALDVARLIGPDKILAKTTGGNDVHAAAGVIRRGLTADAGKGSSVIVLTFENADRTLVEPVLQQVISSYNKMHVEAHLKSGALDDFLDQQIVDAKNQLASTEREIREMKAKVGVISLPDTKRSQAEATARIQENLYADQAELAGSIARLMLLTNRPTAGSDTETNLPVTVTVPAEVQERYKRICSTLELYQKQEAQLQAQFTPDSPMLRGVMANVASNQLAKAELEAAYPTLPGYRVAESVSRGQSDFSATDLVSELAKVRSLEARTKIHQDQLEQLQKQAAAVSEAEGSIAELQRKRDLLEQKYNYLSSRQDRNRFDEALGPNRISNIKDIESPTPAFRDMGKLSQILAIVLGGAFAAAIGLAFVIELYLDRSIKRPIEIETRTKLPLFLSIPKARLNGAGRLNGVQHARLITNGEAHGKNGNGENGASGAVVARKQHQLEPFFEALRDRLIMSFEMRNLVHKPKLVAVTSCGSGAGVSTVASGLAASLSETGDGNVLLVDMNEVGQGAAHYFHKGELQSLDDALEMEKRETAMVQDNLYVVSEKPADGVPRVLHKRFSSLLPRLKASDYDYIIFDMPPVSQISPTPKLARFMDMVFMVVEAEKTNHDAVKRASDLLEESNAHVGVVLNKARNYVPKRLQ